MSDIETRKLIATNVETRKEEDGTRIIRGTAVTYGQKINVGGYTEMFERGAFGEFVPVKLFYNHNSDHLPIGMVTRGEDTDEGYIIEAKLSNTRDANDVYELLKDNVLNTLSVGFQPVENRNEDGTVIRTKANLREVSVVNEPAYAGALISEVRSDNSDGKNNPTNERSEMTDFATSADFNELRDEVKTEIRSLRDNAGTPASVSKFNSLGEFVKGLYTNPNEAKAEVGTLTRAFTGATSVDAGSTPAWVKRDINLIAANRNVLELFSKAPLPLAPSIQYPQFGSSTGTVGVQANEGDDLNYIELVLTNATAPVKTYGAYSSLSRQAIELNDLGYVNAVLNQQKIEYAKATNSAVRAALVGTTGTGTDSIAFADKGKAVRWTEVAVDSAAKIGATGLTADVWVVSPTHFKQLVLSTDNGGRPVFDINGDGANTFGNANLTGLRASVAGLQVVVDPNLTGTVSYIVSSNALTVLENGARYLQDENIVNLTKDFSIYGYMAITVNNTAGVVKVSHPTA